MAADRAPDDVTLTFGGNATTLLRLGGFTLLTDPSFVARGTRVHLGKGLFTTRLTDPALQPADLPPLDAIVLSHLHGDHWDDIATDGLDHGTPLVTTPRGRWPGAGSGRRRTCGPGSGTS